MWGEATNHCHIERMEHGEARDMRVRDLLPDERNFLYVVWGEVTWSLSSLGERAELGEAREVRVRDLSPDRRNFLRGLHGVAVLS